MSAWTQIPLIVGGAFSFSQSPQTHRRLRAALGARGGVQGFAVAARAQQVTHGCLSSDASSSHPDFRSYVPLDGRHPPPAGTRLASAVVLVHVGQLEERLHHTPPCDNLTVIQLESKLTDADQSLLTTWCHASEVKRLSASFPAANGASRPSVSLRPKFLAYNTSLVELDLSHLGPLEEIGDWALCGCSSLATMHFPLEQLPAGMRIGSSVLQAATNLVTVFNMPSLDSMETGGAFFMYGCRCLTLKLDLARLESGFSPRVRRVCLSDITSLTSIDDVSRVDSEGFELSRLPSLTSIGDEFLLKSRYLKVVELSHLPSLHTVGSSFVSCCPELETLNLSGLAALKRVGDGFISYNRLRTVDITPLRESLDLACIGDGFLDSDVLELTVGAAAESPPPPPRSNVATLVKPLLQFPKPRRTLRAELGRMLTDDFQVCVAPSDGSYEDFDLFARDVRTGAFAVVEALLRSECTKVYHATDMSEREFHSFTDGSDNDDDSELDYEGRSSLRHHVIALCKEVQKLFPADAGFLKYKAKSRQLQDRVRYYEGRVETAEQKVADLTKQLDEEKARKRGEKSRRADPNEPSNGGSPHQARHGQPRAGKGR